MIRHASIREIPDVAAIINDCAEHGLMLHRSHSYLYEHVRDFHVAIEDGRVIGVCGLGVVWANLAELYALAVTPRARGRGLGNQLVDGFVGFLKIRAAGKFQPALRISDKMHFGPEQFDAGRRDRTLQQRERT